MKSNFASFTGLFAVILMVVSFVVPTGVHAPSPALADPGIMKWDTVSTPGSIGGKNDILNYHYPLCNGTPRGSDIIDMAVGNDGTTVVWIVKRGQELDLTDLGYGLLTIGPNLFYYSNSSGIIADESRYLALMRAPEFMAELAPGLKLPSNLYQVAIAPDDPKFITVTASLQPSLDDLPITLDSGPKRIYVTSDAGQNWDLAFDGTLLDTGETIRCIDISIDYGGKRDIGFGTASTSAAAGGTWYVRSSTGFSDWSDQDVNLLPPTVEAHNYYALKFSPTYNGDSSVALVYATADATYFNVANRDLHNNETSFYVFADGIEVKDPVAAVDSSPGISSLNRASLQLPSDFSGQSASLRRAYISLDAYSAGLTKSASSKDGIFRIDDSTVYTLMDTSSLPDKSIYSIAYFGTYASGKLLAGERMGYPCSATVPTWFTDSPTTCPIPCWYPALKPTTGAANQYFCTTSKLGVGSALVAWNADGSLGFVSTGFLFDLPADFAITIPPPLDTSIGGWFALKMIVIPPLANDESAFAISRNNGETWNQLSLIDTTIDWFNDVAVAPDCSTIYLASVNRDEGDGCDEFDSVWRSTINPNVAAPLPTIPPLGFYWERVFTHVTAYNCTFEQDDLPILRVVPSCTDKKDGEIVAWASTYSGTQGDGDGGGVMAWSPDFGDFWAVVTPRFPVQDFAFESSTVMYVLAEDGLVQRLPYTGTAWSTTLPSYDTVLASAHTIVAYPEGKVLVGAGPASSAEIPIAWSFNKGETFSSSTGNSIIGHGNMHVIFDVDFKTNNFIYVGDDNEDGTVYRNTIPSHTRWSDNDMMAVANGAAGIDWPEMADPPHPIGIYGLAQAWTGEPQPALYAAHDVLDPNSAGQHDVSAVCRTLRPRDGMPKPGILWDCLDIFAPTRTHDIDFTLEPTSLKYCGCCTLDTNTTLYAIDDERGEDLSGRWNQGLCDPAGPGYTPSANQGMLWAYTDCLAKKGPVLKAPADKYLVGADPVTGRNQQIDLSWEQLCLATCYEVQVAKDKDFTLRVIAGSDWWDGGNTSIVDTATLVALQGSFVACMDKANMTSPAAWIAPGALPEAGAIYWWRIRVYRSATGQYAYSPWSEARSFTVKAGFIVNTPYYGVQLLSPNNGCLGCKVRLPSFSWSPWKEATKYQFDLSKDPEFKQMVMTITTSNTSYEYQGKLDYSTNYFWRVKALEVTNLPIPSDWSATFSFQTEPAPAPPAPPPAEPATPIWVWVIIAIGAILVIVTLILIFTTRRV